MYARTHCADAAQKKAEQEARAKQQALAAAAAPQAQLLGAQLALAQARTHAPPPIVPRPSPQGKLAGLRRSLLLFECGVSRDVVAAFCTTTNAGAAGCWGSWSGEASALGVQVVRHLACIRPPLASVRSLRQPVERIGRQGLLAAGTRFAAAKCFLSDHPPKAASDGEPFLIFRVAGESP